VERKISTFAAPTGDAVVLATFQVTVCVLPPGQDTAELGEVTWNGPAAEVTETVICALLTPPFPSRTETRYGMLRVKRGRDAPRANVLVRRLEFRGNWRELPVTGLNERWNAPLVPVSG